MTHGVLQPAGGLDEQLVAGLVPDGVVDGLEAVQVDEEHGRAVVGGAAAGERLPDALGEQGAVGQVGERVVLGVVLQLGLQAHPFGHVAAVEDQAAVVAVDGRLHVQPAAVAGAEAALDAGRGLLGLARGQEPPHLVDHGAEVLGMDQRGELGADQLLGGPAVHPGGGRADVPQDAVGRGDHDDVAGALHQGPEVVLLLGQFPGERDVVQEHDALAHDERQDDRAAGDEHHAVDAVAVQDVAEDAQRAHGGGQVGRERGERAGEGQVGRIPAEASLLRMLGRHVRLVFPAEPGRVTVDHARTPLLVRPSVSSPHPGGVGEEQGSGEPAGVQQLPRTVFVVQQR